MSVESANSDASKLRLKIKVFLVSIHPELANPQQIISNLTFLVDFRLEVKKVVQKVRARFE